MFLSILGFSLVVIVCLVMGRGNYHPSNLVEYRSTSGWGPGPSWSLGIGNGEYAFAAAGACVHIAEEIPNPSRKVPLVMSVIRPEIISVPPLLTCCRNLTILMGVFTAIPWIIAMTCVVQDMEAIQNAFLPSLELFYQGTGSKAAATFLQVYLTILYYSMTLISSLKIPVTHPSIACVPSQWITSSRMTWAFSRDVRRTPGG